MYIQFLAGAFLKGDSDKSDLLEVYLWLPRGAEAMVGATKELLRDLAAIPVNVHCGALHGFLRFAGKRQLPKEERSAISFEYSAVGIIHLAVASSFACTFRSISSCSIATRSSCQASMSMCYHATTTRQGLTQVEQPSGNIAFRWLGLCWLASVYHIVSAQADEQRVALRMMQAPHAAIEQFREPSDVDPAVFAHTRLVLIHDVAYEAVAQDRHMKTVVDPQHAKFEQDCRDSCQKRI